MSTSVRQARSSHTPALSIYRASSYYCKRCDLKPRCTTGIARKVSRDIDEDVGDYVRSLGGTQAFEQSARERKKVEMRFAHMKRIHKLDRLRLRGLSGAKDEVCSQLSPRT